MPLHPDSRLRGTQISAICKRISCFCFGQIYQYCLAGKIVLEVLEALFLKMRLLKQFFSLRLNSFYSLFYSLFHSLSYPLFYLLSVLHFDRTISSADSCVEICKYLKMLERLSASTRYTLARFYCECQNQKANTELVRMKKVDSAMRLKDHS